MKTFRTIFLLILTCMTLSCKKEPKIDIAEKERIEFQPTVKTKVVIEDNTTLQDNSTGEVQKPGIAIFAKKTELVPDVGKTTTKSTYLMKNVQLTYKQNEWNYSDKFYWGVNCKHEFLAIFPYRQDGYTLSNDIYELTQVSTITPDPPGPNGEASTVGTNNLNDILYGRNVIEYHIKNGEPKPVNLNMRHALTAISFNVRNISKNNVTLKNIRLSGLKTKASKIQIPLVASEQEAPVIIHADPESNKTAYKFADTKEIEGNKTTSIPFIAPFIIVPQDIKGIDIPLTFTVVPTKGDQPYDVNIHLNKFRLDYDSIEHAIEYMPAKHYKYTLDITDNQIYCEVSIVNWIDHTVILK